MVGVPQLIGESGYKEKPDFLEELTIFEARPIPAFFEPAGH